MSLLARTRRRKGDAASAAPAGPAAGTQASGPDADRGVLASGALVDAPGQPATGRVDGAGGTAQPATDPDAMPTTIQPVAGSDGKSAAPGDPALDARAGAPDPPVAPAAGATAATGRTAVAGADAVGPGTTGATAVERTGAVGAAKAAGQDPPTAGPATAGTPDGTGGGAADGAGGGTTNAGGAGSADGTEAAATDAAAITPPPAATTRGRSAMRRRLRHLRRAREVLLRDLGGYVYEVHRADTDLDADVEGVVRAKIDRLRIADAESAALEAVLGLRSRGRVVREPGIGGACAACDELLPSEARFCSRCGTPAGTSDQPRSVTAPGDPAAPTTVACVDTDAGGRAAAR